MNETPRREGELELDKEAIRKAMWRHVEDCFENATGEVNCARLAETVADELDLYEDDLDCTIPDDVFDISAEVGLAFEELQRKRSAR